MIVAAILILASSIISGWISAMRRLHPLDRPLAAGGGAALIIMAMWLLVYLAGVIRAWTTSGWGWGVGAIVVGFWVLPGLFERIFLSIYARQ